MSPTLGRELYNSACIEDAAAQAAMQPWAAMECYQLGPGRQLAQMETFNLGRQQVVRETQLASVQKLGFTPPGFCTLSYCTPAPNFRFSALGADSSNTIFFMSECTEYDIYVPEGIQTSYIGFHIDDFLQGARALNPAAVAAVGSGAHHSDVRTKRTIHEKLLQQVMHIATAQSADHHLA